MNANTTTIFLRMSFYGALVLVFALSLMPTDKVPTIFNVWDKAQHALAFIVLTLLARLAHPRQSAVRVAVGLMIFGGLIEWAQSQTTYRFGDWGDWVADGVGCVVGLIIAPQILFLASSRELIFPAKTQSK